MALQFLKDLAEDLVTLEVATLTNNQEKPIDLKIVLSDEQKAARKAAQDGVTAAKNDLIAAIKAGKRPEIRKQKKIVKAKEKDLSELEKAFGIYDPKDIFSKIKAGLTQSDVVAYSRFELEGDSINFITSQDALQDLAEKHKDMVSAAQESRKALFDTVLKIGS